MCVQLPSFRGAIAQRSLTLFSRLTARTPMAKLIPDALLTRLRSFLETLRHFDWSSLKQINRDDIRNALKNPRWHKPVAIIFALLVAAHVIKNDVVLPYLKAHFALGVDTIEVQPLTVPLESQLVGQTRSPQSVAIYTRVSGFLDKQVYQEGAWVKAGDILFEMDKRPFIVQLDAAKAALEAQEASLRTATLTLNRIKPLAAAKALSQQDLDTATGNFLRAQAGVDQARANLATAQLNLEYCTIRSPIDGLASVRKVALGTYLQVGSPNSELTVVNQMNPMWVYFSVAEDQMLNVNRLLEQKQLTATTLADLDVTITMSDGTLYPYTGKIGFADVLYNVETGTRLMRAVFPNPSNVLQQGQFVTATILGLVQQNVYLVPQAAVQQSSQGAYVWVVDAENRVHSRTIRPGFWNGPNWVINEGLNPGEQVVISNVLRMSPNQLVKPNRVKSPEAQPVHLPTPPETSQTLSPYGPGVQLSPGVNQAQDPQQQPMPVAPPTPERLQAPRERPLAPGVPMAPAPLPDSLKAPAPRAAQ